MALIGRALLILALGVAVFGICASLYGARTGRREWVDSGRRSVYALAALATLAFAILENAFWRNDFSFNVVMVKEKGHARTLARLGVPQHRQITVRVAKSQDRAAPHVQGDVLGLRLAIVETVEFR